MRPGFDDGPAAPQATRSPAWLAAVTLSVAVLGLHLYFWRCIGGLWQDEVNSVNLARGPLGQMSHDSFPILMPLLLRGWCWLGLGGADMSLRLFGVLGGLALAGAFWVTAWLARRQAPLWSLALGALNGWMIYYGASLRAYGLGSALVVLCVGAAWNHWQNPSRKTWFYFAVAATLSVQALYQNSALVAGICAGVCAVGWRRRRFQPVAGAVLAGFTAAVSLLPYWVNVSQMSQAAAPLRLDFDWVIALNDLKTLLGFPLPQFFWVWLILAAAVLVRGGLSVGGAGRNDPAGYAAVTLIVGGAAFVGFLYVAKFPVQPWYFLPLLALAAACCECSFPRLETGWFKAPLWGGIIATAGISILFAVPILNWRFTNLDLLARKIAASARENDFVVVTPWEAGITFGRYFQGPCPWSTLPPLDDHSTHRYDLVKRQMQNTNALAPVFEHIAAALRSGGSVWVIGGIGQVNAPTEPPSPPLPPLPYTGWQETPYNLAWHQQTDWFLRRHSTEIDCVDPGTSQNINFTERNSLYRASGWRETPPAGSTQ